MVNKTIILQTKTPTTYHIGDVVNTPLWDNWYDSIFTNDEKMGKYTTFSAPFERSSLTPGKKIRPRISLRVKIINIENQYDLYSRTCSYVSSMLEGV